MESVIEQIQNTGIVPVIVIDDVKDARPLAKALMEGGLPCAEITFRTLAAEESIRIISEEFSNMLVGAGTILNNEQADKAIAAGAKFIVSPGTNKDLIKHCMKKKVLIIPGACTPTEVEMALKYELSVLKFFPAEPSGGIEMIKALNAPYVNVRFMPTGGIKVQNVKDYLAHDKVIACGGTWMVDRELIRKGDFEKIKKLTKEAAEIVKSVRGAK